MNNNDVFRKILHLTGLGVNPELIIHIFELGGVTATKSKIKGWRTSLSNSRASPMPDNILDAFFNGFFEYRDDMREEGVNIFNLKR